MCPRTLCNQFISRAEIYLCAVRDFEGHFLKGSTVTMKSEAVVVFGSGGLGLALLAMMMESTSCVSLDCASLDVRVVEIIV